MPTTQTVAGVKEVDPRTAKQWLDAGEAVLIDVREPDEHARERIPGASLSPLSRFDASALKAHSTRIVLHCKSGRRSMDAAARALNAGCAEAYTLTGGLEAWKAAGLEVLENRRVPISLMRQVQIAVGVILLVGTALAWWVSPWFIIVPAFIGAGQLFAGLSGTCGMAALLSMAPWNKVARAAAAPG